MRILCVYLLALLSVHKAHASIQNSLSMEPGEDHAPVRDVVEIYNPDEEDMGDGSGDFSIEGSGNPSQTVGSGIGEILVLDIRVTQINGEEAKFTPELLDNETPYFKTVERDVCEGIRTIMINEVDIDCNVLAFKAGSIIAETQLNILPSSVASVEDVQLQIESVAQKGTIGRLTVDPTSIIFKSPEVEMVSTDAPKMVTTGLVKSVVTDMKTKVMQTKIPTTGNDIVFVPESTQDNVEIEVAPTRDPDKEFFDRLLENPALLAGMVGAVVLVLLTMILLSMFIVYRVKKKDEGSYSLDEPGKMKDPQAYWKDTKEFYA